MFFFEAGDLQKLAQERHSEYVNNTPFPHIVIDNFLPEDVAQAIVDEFPSPEDKLWKRKKSEQSVKLANNDTSFSRPHARQVLSQLNTSEMLKFLETLTGIPNLLADPHFFGGGYHQIERGGVVGSTCGLQQIRKL